MKDKTDAWESRRGRKLRVVFLDDVFHAYVDLPSKSGAQKEFEKSLRSKLGGKISLYIPGSPYRDRCTPALNESNCLIWQDCSSQTPAKKIASPALNARQRTVKSTGQRMFDTWWEAMAAIPVSRTATDWWAEGSDRAPPYQRLRRVWLDTTRNWWFYDSGREDHLTATLWENLSLFHPSSSVPAILAASGLEEGRPVLDACWSYEFEQFVGGKLKQTDVIMHYRDSEDDAVLVIEAKRPHGPLKETDLKSDYYLDLPSFEEISRRAVVYLVDESDLLNTRRSVQAGRYPVGFVTWQKLGAVQISLIDKLNLNHKMATFLKGSLQWQFDVHGLGSQAIEQAEAWTMPRIINQLWSMLDGFDKLSDPIAMSGNLISAMRQSNVTAPAKQFAMGMIQHQAAWYGYRPGSLAADYLEFELRREDVVSGMRDRQRTAHRRLPMWKLPARRTSP